jgi:hypothetical protein
VLGEREMGQDMEAPEGKHLNLSDPKLFGLFVRPGEIVEVRILKASGKSQAWGNESARGIVSGYFDRFEACCKAVQTADKACHGGIYFTLQVIDPQLLGRSFNRLKPSDLTTSDSSVLFYRWLPVDLDPVRACGDFFKRHTACHVPSAARRGGRVGRSRTILSLANQSHVGQRRPPTFQTS